MRGRLRATTGLYDQVDDDNVMMMMMMMMMVTHSAFRIFDDD